MQFFLDTARSFPDEVWFTPEPKSLKGARLFVDILQGDGGTVAGAEAGDDDDQGTSPVPK